MKARAAFMSLCLSFFDRWSFGKEEPLFRQAGRIKNAKASTALRFDISNSPFACQNRGAVTQLNAIDRLRAAPC